MTEDMNIIPELKITSAGDLQRHDATAIHSWQLGRLGKANCAVGYTNLCVMHKKDLRYTLCSTTDQRPPNTGQ